MYYITGVSYDNSLYELTDCLTGQSITVTGAQLGEREDIFDNNLNVSKYYSCTETPDEGELDLLLEDYPNGVKHIEANRYFLFIPVREVKTVQKPIYVLTRYKSNSPGIWQLFMLHKSDKGATRVAREAFQTDNKGDAMRKANSINDYYKQRGWKPANYQVMTLTEALQQIEMEDNQFRF